MLNKIAGQMLQDDLLRDGVNFAIDGTFIYFDVVNTRLGINQGTPAASLDVDGTMLVTGQANIGNIILLNSSITSDTGDLALSSTNGNINVSSKRIVGCANPIDDTDVVNLQSLTGALSAFDTSKIIAGNSSLTVVDDEVTPGSLSFEFDSIVEATMNATQLDLQDSNLLTTGEVNSGTAQLGDLNFSGSTITSDGTTITLGTLTNIVDTAINSVLFNNGDGNIATSADFGYDGSTLSVTGKIVVDSLTLDSTTLLSSAGLNLTSSSGNDIVINPGTGVVSIDGTTSLRIPVGTTLQRPSSPSTGYFRFNTLLNASEIYDGTNWSAVGNAYADIEAQTIVPDGSSTAYSLNQTATTGSILVSLNGVLQAPVSDYSVSGTTITFGTVLLVTDTVVVRFFTAATTIIGLADAVGTTTMTTALGIATIEVLGNDILVMDGSTISFTTDLIPSADNTYDIGSATNKIQNIFTNQINSSPADIAEKFTSDTTYTPGTVMILGGTKEVTKSMNYADPAVAGIVTTNPAYIMNSDVEGDAVTIALAGRTPCKVVGPISKGDILTTSSTPGYATRLDPGTYTPGCVIAKAMENCLSGEHVIMVMIFTS